MVDLLKTAMAAIVLKTYLLLMDFNEFRVDLEEWKEGRHQKLCRSCGQKIVRGSGVIISGTEYYYCQDCIRKEVE